MMASEVEEFAVKSLLLMPPCFAQGEFAHCWIRHDGIDMNDLFPKLTYGPWHRVVQLVVLDHMEPAAVTAGGAERLFELLIA